MNAHELRDVNQDDLHEKLHALRWKIAEMRVKHKRRELENPMHLREARKDVAKILTVLSEK